MLSQCLIKNNSPGDAELVPTAAGLAAGKPNDTPSFPDSALGRSSVISGTTAGVTQVHGL